MATVSQKQFAAVMFFAVTSHKVVVFWKFFEISFDLVKIGDKNRRFAAYISQ